MNFYVQRVGMAAATVLGAVSLWACTATREADGSVTLRFAPDMVVTAVGLENLATKLQDLLRDCLDGTFHRTCTPEERADVLGALRSTLRTKDGLIRPA
jgi:hypothetical protein